MKKVLIVMPAYNAEHYILETLESALASTYKNIHIVVVNDGSTDRTAEIVESINDQRITLVNRTNSGMSASRNFGANTIDSDLIALLDSDDIWHPRKLELQIDYMQENTGVDFCYTGFKRYFGQGKNVFLESDVSKDLDDDLSGYIYEKMLLDNWALPSSVLFTRSLWEKMGPFLCNDQQTDDWEYFVRASLSFRFAKLKSLLVLYRQLPNSLSRRVPKINSGEIMRESFVNKYGLRSPQGNMVDLAALDGRRYNRRIEFYDLHVNRGNFLKGAKGFLEVFLTHDKKTLTLSKFVKSTLHRLLNLH